MITYPNAKINIGLNILNKRKDGFHDIASLFYPIALEDALEILPTSGPLSYSTSGIALDCDASDNLVMKAFLLLKDELALPNVQIHLHKNIPFGAGLGGGSSDAAFALRMLNEMFELGLSEEALMAYAARLGADCAFFIKNKPQMAHGIGDELSVHPLDLTGKHLLLLKPDVTIPTAAAYQYVRPALPTLPLEECLNLPMQKWKDLFKNDFERSVFKQYPQLATLKNALYKMGAVYASMSGSGASIFGLFEQKPESNTAFDACFRFEAVL